MLGVKHGSETMNGRALRHAFTYRKLWRGQARGHATPVAMVGIISWGASEGQVQEALVLGLREAADEGGIGPRAHWGSMRWAVGGLRRSGGSGERCLRLRRGLCCSARCSTPSVFGLQSAASAPSACGLRLLGSGFAALTTLTKWTDGQTTPQMAATTTKLRFLSTVCKNLHFIEWFVGRDRSQKPGVQMFLI